jgi:hypothetical protein
VRVIAGKEFLSQAAGLACGVGAVCWCRLTLTGA